MGFLSFLKGTNPKQTKEYKDTIKKLEKKPEVKDPEIPVPEPVNYPVLTTTVVDQDGNMVELVDHTILKDGMCIIDDGYYYHTYVGCGLRYKGIPRLTTIEEAIKAGKDQCESCIDKIEREYQEFDDMLDGKWDD